MQTLKIEILELAKRLPKSKLKKAINTIGVQSLCGISDLKNDNPLDYMISMQEYEISEIVNLALTY